MNWIFIGTWALYLAIIAFAVIETMVQIIPLVVEAIR